VDILLKRVTSEGKETIDRASAREICGAFKENPNLPFSIRIASERYLHASVIIVDDQVGTMSTLFPWTIGLNKSDGPSGSEFSLIFSGASLASMRMELVRAIERIGPFRPYFAPFTTGANVVTHERPRSIRQQRRSVKI
jgi:hypothetical protein